MLCTMKKIGKECTFAKNESCELGESGCKEVIDKCLDLNGATCTHIEEYGGKKYCTAYALPETKWKMGNCNFATHIMTEVKSKKIINALKASKRRARGK